MWLLVGGDVVAHCRCGCLLVEMLWLIVDVVACWRCLAYWSTKWWLNGDPSWWWAAEPGLNPASPIANIVKSWERGRNLHHSQHNKIYSDNN